MSDANKNQEKDETKSNDVLNHNERAHGSDDAKSKKKTSKKVSFQSKNEDEESFDDANSNKKKRKRVRIVSDTEEESSDDETNKKIRKKRVKKITEEDEDENDKENEEDHQEKPTTSKEASAVGAKSKEKDETKKYWSDEECVYLIAGVQLFGTGNWKKIFNEFSDQFKGRTPQNLNDKHRNLTKSKTQEKQLKVYEDKAKKLLKKLKKN